MSKRSFLILMGLAGALPPGHALGSLFQGAPFPGQFSLSLSDAVSSPAGAPPPENLLQGSPLPQEVSSQGDAHSQDIQRGTRQNAQQHQIPNRAPRPQDRFGKNHTHKANGFAYIRPEHEEEMTPADKCKAQRTCREALKTGIKGDLQDKRLLYSLHKGTRVERVTLSLELDEAVKIFKRYAPLEARGALKAARAHNLKTLRRIKDLAIEHLTVEIDFGEGEVVQRILEWVGKNPYGEMKSFKIKDKSFSSIFHSADLDFLLPTPMGEKIYPQKKLKDFAIEGSSYSELLNANVITLMEKIGEIKNLRFKGGDQWLYPENPLKILARGHFPHLEAFSVSSDQSVLEEIKKASWACQLTSLHLAAPEDDVSQNMLFGFSKASFPALRALKFSHFQNEEESFEELLQNVPDLKVFHAYNCVFDPLKFSKFLKGFSGALEDLNFEDLKYGGKKEFYQLSWEMAKNLKSLTLKNCKAKGKRLEWCFEGSKSFAMRFLDLSDNRMGEKEFEVVFSKKFPNLEHLKLSGNDLEIGAVDFLVRNHGNFLNLKSLTLPRACFESLSSLDQALREGHKGSPLKVEADYEKKLKTVFSRARISWE